MNIGTTLSNVLGASNANINNVTIDVNGKRLSGWTRVSIRRGIEIMPSTFELECTESIDQASALPEGASCIIRIGLEPVITGYILTVTRRLTANEHILSVQGTSKTTDLCECSAKFSTYQFNNVPVIDLITQICKPYGIGVKTVGNVENIVIPQFAVILTETGYEIIERMTRTAALLFYDDTDGNIIVSKVGSTMAASGFVEGKNVEEVSVRRSMAGRFSSVDMILQTMAPLQVFPSEDHNLAQQMKNLSVAPPAVDPMVKRYRPLLISAEMGDAGYQVAQQRAQWEVNRRFGRSQTVQVVTDSWRDQSRKLWTPNTLAPVSFPTLKVNTNNKLLICETVFRLGNDGTHAEITLMPAEAFMPQPIVLNAANSGVVQAMAGE
ncbi:Mu-like prophage tail protein gpP (PDB:3D37) [Commensalibacter communis]|uniref:Mu-like prophage tail protein gpP n=1 Tax=Commensalibacter communis TaxID=2972786 RepID=A0A9W4TR96_9PROT|nr:phage tail protein [Commensalibacter communis]CAI3953381.1 Mu-like prophage tail protein gpP (PDB:3D37) [Commensalibacter communis]CAI3956450.1 Mu-like prophage tail protein gpP (PDB:3D37) [Commensalibacter communis]CAI3956801.1 Mu-like prophage tail protein gpP (PDB:3D37) [Commensalibacter communis]CAI3957207.1 Mu-like prophage tail protein gpP (PDB:3D37) [Commensalibacter communis]